MTPKNYSREELRPGLISNGAYLPYNPDLVSQAKELRKTMTEAERKLWDGYLKITDTEFFDNALLITSSWIFTARKPS